MMSTHSCCRSAREKPISLCCWGLNSSSRRHRFVSSPEMNIRYVSHCLKSKLCHTHRKDIVGCCTPDLYTVSGIARRCSSCKGSVLACMHMLMQQMCCDTDDLHATSGLCILGYFTALMSQKGHHDRIPTFKICTSMPIRFAQALLLTSTSPMIYCSLWQSSQTNALIHLVARALNLPF